MKVIVAPFAFAASLAILLPVTDSAEPNVEQSSITQENTPSEAFRVFVPAQHIKIREALVTTRDVGFKAIPLDKVMQGFADDYGIPIWIDRSELERNGIDPSTPLTLSVPPMTFRSALNLILSPLELDFVYRDEVLCITSKSAVDAIAITMLYEIATPYSDDDVAELIEKTSLALHDPESPKPVVHLLSSTDLDARHTVLFVRANKSTHEDVERTLRLLRQQLGE